MELKNNRIEWVDIAKLFGMYLVIVGHIPFLANEKLTYLNNFIYGFHMPLFFFLSGFVHKEKAFSENAVKVWKGIVIPYLVLSFIVTLIMIPMVLNIDEGLFYNIKHFFIAPTLGIFFAGSYRFPDPFGYTKQLAPQMWFLIALAECKLLCSISYKKVYQLIILTFSFVFAMIFALLGLKPFFCIGSSFMAYIFYFSGYYFRKIYKENPEEKLYCKIFKFVIALLAYCFLHHFSNHIFSIMLIYIGDFNFLNVLMYVMKGFSGIAAMVYFCSLIPSIPSFLKIYAENTIIILAFHFPMIMYSMKFIKIRAIHEILIFSAVVLFLNIVPIVVVQYMKKKRSRI